MTRLLFVDDEPRILGALRQSLRGQRKVWEMEFLESADAALDRLQSWRCDAVISDMRMPGIDGAELLKRVRSMQPDTLRIVLSGQMDDAAAGRAAASAHRFLAKPCDTETLVATLTRALELRDHLQSVSMRTCIGGMGTLPSLPAHCQALNQALQNENVSLDTVAKIIEVDAGMTAKALQLVNSSFFGLPRRIASIEQAIGYLGLNAVRSVVMAHALFQELAGGNAAQLEAAQVRSLLVARYARRFRLGRLQAEAAATAALLHNVGELALLARLPKEHQADLAYARHHGVTTSEAERVRLGVTHAELGAYLLGLWGLPYEVVEAVGSQDAPVESFRVLDPSAVVWLARGLAAETLESGARARGLLPDEVVARLGATDMITTLREEIAEGIGVRKAS